jgi:hypothetical protein
MAQPTRESERVTALFVSCQQLPIQVRHWIPNSGKRRPSGSPGRGFSEPDKSMTADKTFFPFSLRRAFLGAHLSASIFGFTVTPLLRKRAAAVAVADRICAVARRALWMAAALLGGAAFAAFGGTALKAQTVSFTGAQGMLGSGFNAPSDVAVESTGNLFIADQGNNAVKEILAAGNYATVNTLAAANGNFNSPTGVAVDESGNVFVADLGNSVVKEILAAGGYTTVKTLATNGSFISPTGVAVDATGDVFVADQGANAVNEILAAAGYMMVNTLAVSNGNFYEPSNVAVDGSGDVFVADYGNSTVKEILATGGYAAIPKRHLDGPTVGSTHRNLQKDPVHKCGCDAGALAVTNVLSGADAAAGVSGDEGTLQRWKDTVHAVRNARALGESRRGSQSLRGGHDPLGCSRDPTAVGPLSARHMRQFPLIRQPWRRHETT